MLIVLFYYIIVIYLNLKSIHSTDSVSVSNVLTVSTWRSVSCSSSGQYIYTLASYDNIYKSNDYGSSFEFSFISKAWVTLSSSALGDVVVAAATNDYIYINVNYGDPETWNTLSSNGNHMWYSLSISPSGDFIYATENNNKQMYKYTNQSAQSQMISSQKDYFLTRIAVTNSDDYVYVAVKRGYIYKLDPSLDNRSMIYKKLALWTSIATSSNGIYIYAVEETGHIHISNNYGLLNSWSVYSSMEGLWSSITSSITGEVVISVDKLGKVVRSIDYGVTWESFSNSLKSKILTSVAVTNDIYGTVYVTAFNYHIYTLQDTNYPTYIPTTISPTISPTTSNPTADPTAAVVDLNVNLFNNIDFNIPALSINQYQRFEGTFGGWYLSATISNRESAYSIRFPYPYGDQCVVLQHKDFIYQNVSLEQYYTYNLSWYASGRDYSYGSNTIQITLEDMNSEEITPLDTFTPPVNAWTSYSITFTPTVTSDYIIYIQGEIDSSIGDASTALQHIQIEAFSSPYVTISIVNAWFGTSYLNEGIDVTSTVQLLVDSKLSFNISTSTLSNPNLSGDLYLWFNYIIDDGTEDSFGPSPTGGVVIINTTNQPLTVDDAWFGSQYHVLGEIVTSTVQSLLNQNIVSIQSSVENFGDPQSGVHKYLWVTYSYFDSTQNTVTITEGQYLYFI